MLAGKALMIRQYVVIDYIAQCYANRTAGYSALKGANKSISSEPVCIPPKMAPRNKPVLAPPISAVTLLAAPAIVPMVPPIFLP